MPETFKAGEVEIGYHPDGYRIDKTASPMNRYTRWNVSAEGVWSGPEPVCFDSLPQDGWVKAEGFNWEENDPVGKGEEQDR
jgi:hypothetical protein